MNSLYSKITILYVEDDISVIEFVKVLFKKNGILNVTFAQNGQEAYELYKENGFDLVITDMIMPLMNGFELIEKIKNIEPHQVIMMVTGLDSKEDLIKAIELRVNFFVEKPINPKKFSATLCDGLSQVYQRQQLALSNLLLEQYKVTIDESTILSKTDLDGLITYANKEFCRVSGYSLDELIGKTHSIVRHPDMPKTTFQDLWKTIKSKQIWKGKIKNKAKDGSYYIVDALVMPLLDTHGDIIEYIAIRHNITDLEDYKELLQKELALTTKGLDEKVHQIKEYEKAIDESASFSRTDLSGKITYVNGYPVH